MVPGSGRVPSMPQSVHNRLVELTDPTTLKDMYDLRGRIRELDKIFVEHKDDRGLFTSLYRVITDGAVDSVERGLYEDNTWASKLTHNFGRRYLANLHGDLTGGDVTGAWKSYYKQARDPSVSRERVTGMGAIVHLVLLLCSCSLWAIRLCLSARLAVSCACGVVWHCCYNAAASSCIIMTAVL